MAWSGAGWAGTLRSEQPYDASVGLSRAASLATLDSASTAWRVSFSATLDVTPAELLLLPRVRSAHRKDEMLQMGLVGRTPEDRPARQRALLVRSEPPPHASHQRSPQPGEVFAAVFQTRSLWRKRKMGGAEAAQYLLTGVQPARRRPGSPRNSDGELRGAEGAKAAAERWIHEREQVLLQLHELLPQPATEAAARAMSLALLAAPDSVDRLRAQLVQLLRSLRHTSAAICHAAAEWRRRLQARSAYFGSLPTAHVPFLYLGENYILRMGFDAAFLPAPVESDPLLLEWAANALPWIAANAAAHGELLMGLDAEPEVVSMFAVGPEERRALGAAQSAILDEAGSCVSSVLPLSAKMQVHSPVAREWRWHAYQVLLYGGECYATLRGGLGRYRAWTRYLEAVRCVQRFVRSRIDERVVAAQLAVVDEARVQEAHRVRAKKSGAAERIQTRFRGFRIR